MKLSDYKICLSDGVITLNTACPVCNTQNRLISLPLFLYSFKPTKHSRLLNIKLEKENEFLTIRNAIICQYNGILKLKKL